MESGDPSNQYYMAKASDNLLIARERCLELSHCMSVYKMFEFTTQRVVIEFPDGTSDCPEPKSFKNVSTF